MANQKKKQQYQVTVKSAPAGTLKQNVKKNPKSVAPKQQYRAAGRRRSSRRRRN